MRSDFIFEQVITTSVFPFFITEIILLESSFAFMPLMGLTGFRFRLNLQHPLACLGVGSIQERGENAVYEFTNSSRAGIEAAVCRCKSCIIRVKVSDEGTTDGRTHFVLCVPSILSSILHPSPPTNPFIVGSFGVNNFAKL